MKTNKILLATAIAASVMAGSCSEERFAPEGEGRLMLTAAINTEVRDASRADAETEELGESCMIWISNEKGLVRRYIGINICLPTVSSCSTAAIPSRHGPATA